MGYPLENLFGCCFLIRVYAFSMVLTWIWFSTVNGPALPKNMCIKVDKARPRKIGSEK